MRAIQTQNTNGFSLERKKEGHYVHANKPQWHTCWNKSSIHPLPHPSPLAITQSDIQGAHPNSVACPSVSGLCKTAQLSPVSSAPLGSSIILQPRMWECSRRTFSLSEQFLSAFYAAFLMTIWWTTSTALKWLVAHIFLITLWTSSHTTIDSTDVLKWAMRLPWHWNPCFPKPLQNK